MSTRPLPINVTVCLARPDDQLTMATIAAKANFDDDLFGKIIHPHREEFPEDMHLYWLKRLRKAWNNPYSLFLVSKVQHDGAEVVTGMAQWTRMGKGLSDYTSPPRTDHDSVVPVNRAADPEMEDVLERSGPYIPRVWTGSRFECWHLNRLAIDPAYQGQRHGTALVNYGLNLATEENVAASVISAARKGVAERFYPKLGFESIGVRAADGEGNPLRGIEGGEIMFKDRESAEH